MLKYIYLFLGTVTLILGTIGVVLPILPTTPFLLLTFYFYGKGSQKFQDWLISTDLYKNHAKEFVETRSLSLNRKIFILAFASSMLLFPLFILSGWLKLIIIAVYIFLYYYFIFRIKTIR